MLAVKRMPNTWTCRDAREFDERYPETLENPWLDIAFLDLLGNVGFPYACRLHGVFRSADETFVASSFCAEGDLFEWCWSEHLSRPGREREAQIRPIVAQVCAAVRWLHDLGIAHRDLSLENILLTRSGPSLQVKIIDFGAATLRRTVQDEVTGKAAYRAPELHSGDDVDTFLADAFALGVVFFAMASQDYPWASTRLGNCESFEYVWRFGLPSFLRTRRVRDSSGDQRLADVFTSEFVDFLSALLQVCPKQRASVGECAFDGRRRFRRRPSVWSMSYMDGADSLLLCLPLCTGKDAAPSHSGSTCSYVSGSSSISESLSLDRSSAAEA